MHHHKALPLLNAQHSQPTWAASCTSVFTHVPLVVRS